MARSIFISYSHPDETLKSELIEHLSALKREGLVDVWHDRKLQPGEILDEAIEAQLSRSSIILLLISSAFINSDYCSQREMVRAFERASQGKAIVVSIILRPCQWASIPVTPKDKLGDFVALPTDAQPVTTYPNHDVAWNEIVARLRSLIVEKPRSRAAEVEPALSPSTDSKNISAKMASKFASTGVITKTIHEHLADAVRYLTDIIEIDTIKFGFKDLDKFAGGMHPGEFVLLASRPLMGKSALAATFALNACRQLGNPEETDRGSVLWFSTETSANDVCFRLLAQHTDVSLGQVRHGLFTDSEWERFVLGMADMGNLRLILSVGPGSPSHIEEVVNELDDSLRPRLIVVDSIQKTEAWQAANSHKRAVIVKNLKELATSLGVPVIATFDLPATVDDRSDKRPFLSDIENLNSIHSSIDTFLLLYREAFYLTQKEPEAGTPEHAKWLERMERTYNLAEIFVERPAHRQRDRALLAFDQARFTFKDIE